MAPVRMRVCRVCRDAPCAGDVSAATYEAGAWPIHRLPCLGHRARSHTALAQKRTSRPMDTPATFDHKHTTKSVGIGMIEGRVDDPTVD
jgi:hypothetical protein